MRGVLSKVSDSYKFLCYGVSILMLTFLFSCVASTPDFGVPATAPAELKPQLPFSVEGVSYQGFATVERKTSSKISVKLPDKTELVVLSTCGRQKEFWKPDTSKLFVYEYRPGFDIETKPACPMSIIAVTSLGEWHRSIIDFTNAPKSPLPAEVYCNGEWLPYNGGSGICSVSEGLPVAVWPKERVVIAGDPTSGCLEPKPVAGSLAWEVPAKKGFCVYVVLTKDKEFRLTTHGYSSFLRVYPPEVKK